jgi:Tetratricopeptide repeat
VGGRRFRFSPRSALFVVPSLLALAVSLYFVLAAGAANGAFGFPLDDAWIHLSFARTFAATGRFADFVGGPVTSGSTSPLFTLLEALLWRLVHNELAVGYGLGIAAFLLAAPLMARVLLNENHGQPWLAAVGVAAFVLQPKIVASAASGMETTTAVALSLLCLWQAWRRSWGMVGLVAGLLLWTRPDTLIFTAALAVHLLYGMVVEKAADRARMSRALLTFGALALGYFAFNWALSGTLFPNSLAAKIEYYRFGNARFASDLWTFLNDARLLPALPLFLVSLAGTVQDVARRRPAPSLHAHLFVVALVAVYWWKLPFLYQDGRYLIPAIPFVLLGMVDGLRRIAAALGAPKVSLGRAGAVVAALPLLLGMGMVGLAALRLPKASRDFAGRCRDIEELQVATARWCRDHLPATAVIATHDIGALGFYSGRPIVDVVGLLDRGIQGHIGDPSETLAFMRERGVTHLAFLSDWIEVPNENPLLRIDSATGEVMQVMPLTPRTRISSPPVRSLDELAEQRLLAGDSRQALTALAEASRLEPTNPRTHYLAGALFVETGALDRAEHELQISLRFFPDSAQALAALGQLAYRRAEYPQAVDLFRRSLAADPTNREVSARLDQARAHLPDGTADRSTSVSGQAR